MSKTNTAKLSLILASVIFGTLGGFTRFVTMPSTVRGSRAKVSSHITFHW